jgi:hypothetical protein
MQVTFINQHNNTGIINGMETLRYQYVLMPESLLREGLEKWFEEMGYSSALPNKLHDRGIAIAGFNATPRLEDTLSRWTQRICSQVGPFSLEFNNFSGEPPNTVFLRIQDISPIRQLLSNLRKLDMYLTGNGQEPIEPANRCFLPVWQGVPAKSFENLLYRLGREAFYLKVQVQSLVLQKMVRGKWINVQCFPLSVAGMLHKD